MKGKNGVDFKVCDRCGVTITKFVWFDDRPNGGFIWRDWECVCGYKCSTMPATLVLDPTPLKVEKLEDE